MDGFCKLSEAATRLGCEVEDFLKTAAYGKIRLFCYCDTTVSEIRQNEGYYSQTGEGFHFHTVYRKDDYEDDAYAQYTKSGYIELEQSDLHRMYREYDPRIFQKITFQSRYVTSEEILISYKDPIIITREAIFIKKQDIENFIPPDPIETKINAFTSKSLQKAIQCNNELYGEGIPKDAISDHSENRRIRKWIVQEWADAPPGIKNHLCLIVKPTNEEIKDNKK
jgi:hypothetical protein